MKKLVWQQLARDPNDKSDIVTYRARVPGGWLVSVWAARAKEDGTGKPIEGGANWGGGLTFMEGSETEWDDEIVEEKKRA